MYPVSKKSPLNGDARDAEIKKTPKPAEFILREPCKSSQQTFLLLECVVNHCPSWEKPLYKLAFTVLNLMTTWDYIYQSKAPPKSSLQIKVNSALFFTLLCNLYTHAAYNSPVVNVLDKLWRKSCLANWMEMTSALAVARLFSRLRVMRKSMDCIQHICIYRLLKDKELLLQ